MILLDIITAHIIGDYFLQPKKMAISKNKSILWCFIHCIIYTVSMSLFLYPKNNWALTLFIFSSHYAIDSFSLAHYWLKLIRGRDVIKAAYSISEPQRDIDLSFSCIVYVVVDNAMHLIPTLYLAKGLFE